jgi:hypothetical protein
MTGGTANGGGGGAKRKQGVVADGQPLPKRTSQSSSKDSTVVRAEITRLYAAYAVLHPAGSDGVVDDDDAAERAFQTLLHAGASGERKRDRAAPHRSPAPPACVPQCTARSMRRRVCPCTTSACKPDRSIAPHANAGSCASRRLAARLVPGALPRFPSHLEATAQLLMALHQGQDSRGDDVGSLVAATRSDALRGLGAVLDVAQRTGEGAMDTVQRVVDFLLR